jgi:hypothetical protein
MLRVCDCRNDGRDGGYIRRGGRVTLADNEVTGLEMKDRLCPNEFVEDVMKMNGSQKPRWVFTASANVQRHGYTIPCHSFCIVMARA